MQDDFDENEIVHGMYIHIVWSTRNQMPVLDSIAQYLYQYICDKALDLECHVIDGRAFNDHVQLIVKFNPHVSIDNLVKTLKDATSMLIRSNIPELKTFEWQQSEFFFTVSSEEACSIITTKAKPFKNEICNILKQNGLNYKLKEVLL